MAQAPFISEAPSMAPPHTGVNSRQYPSYHPDVGFKPLIGRKSKKQLKEEEARKRRPPPQSQLRNHAEKPPWSRMKPKIAQLCHTNGYQLRVVKDIVWSIYQFGVRYVSHAELVFLFLYSKPL